MRKNFIKSPLNYMGGKYKILPTIIPLLQSRPIKNFYDVFAGGFNVGINIECERILCNDQISFLIEMFQVFSESSFDEIYSKVQTIILKYELSKTNRNGYLSLRKNYNNTRDCIELFVLTCYSFNHQIRFNGKHEFNTPFGKERSSYNKNIERNLKEFVDAMNKKTICFSKKDFRDIDYTVLTSDDLAYFDPPYLISTGSYNDGKRGFKDWKKQDELDLLSILDELNTRGVPFALSNVLQNKGLSNDILIDWASQYNIHRINSDFSNCSYHYKDRASGTVEVLVTNY